MRVIAFRPLIWVCGLAVTLGQAMSCRGADYSDTILSQAPVGYWRLGESASPPPPLRPRPAVNQGSLGTEANGPYLMGAAPGEPGALGGAANTSTRFKNPSLDVALGKSKVEVPYNDALNPQGAFTVEFWARPKQDVTNAFCPVASIDSDPSLAQPPDRNPRAGWIFYQRGQTNGSPTDWQFKLGNGNNYLDGDELVGGLAATGVWNHVVGVYDGTSAMLYVNGVQVASRAIGGFQANRARPLRIGTSCFDGSLGDYAGNRGFDGWLQEVAVYDRALSGATIAAHHTTGLTDSAGYANAVLADQPVGYWRLGEAADPLAANLGRLGTEGDGVYVYSANPGQAGPSSPAFPGFATDNRACGFRGTNGYVELPPLGLRTNAVTITAWVFSDGVQTPDTRVVFAHAGATQAGLKFDVNDPNGLSYDWNADSAAANFKSSLVVPDSRWAFVAMIVQPEQAVLCLHDGSTFATATNYTYHPEQSFDDVTLIGAEAQDGSLTFQGRIDEVAVFNRALGVGEVYSQYASAVGGIKPSIFGNVSTPPNPVYEGDTLVLSVDVGGTPPLSYQWRKDGNPIPGATHSVLSREGVSAIDSASYDVVVTNPQGSVTSLKASVSVLPVEAPTIALDPRDRTLYAGGAIDLNVQASGGGLKYAWQRNGVSIPGATNASYLVTSATNTDAGTYQATVTNSKGSARSQTATITVITPAAGSYEAAIVSDGPEAWWRLDEMPGSDVLTDAMARHDGVYKGEVEMGAPGVIAGSDNPSARFDGGSGYAEVPFAKSLNPSSFTVECWVRANSLLPSMCPLGSFTQPPGRGYLVHKSWEGDWAYFFGNGSDFVVYYITGSDALYDQWVLVTLTYEDGLFAAYLNGRLDSYIFDNLMPNNSDPLRIGVDRVEDGWSDFWNGDIDEVAVYPRVLSDERIAAHYAAARYGANHAPVFTRQPEPRSVVVSSNAYLSTVVEGSAPLSYQWNKNGIPMVGETNDDLFITNTTFADIGVYTLTASNAAGVTLSSPATLTIVPKPVFAGVTNGLVLHLAFENDYLDTSGRGNHGQPVGAPRFVTGAVGASALHYSTFVDNTDPDNVAVVATNYVTLGDPPDLRFGTNASFTVGYWVRFRGKPGDLPFFCNSLNAYGNPGFTFAPSYQLGGWSWSLQGLGTSDYLGIYGNDNTINDNRWHHLLHTFDRSGSGETYLDGRWVDSRSVVPIGDLDTGLPINIGQDGAGDYPEEGQADIDDLAVWRRVLTPFEVYSVYTVGAQGLSFDVFGPVSLTFQRSKGSLELVWPAGTLQEGPSIDGPWTTVPNASAPYFQVAPEAGNRFYRVHL